MKLLVINEKYDDLKINDTNKNGLINLIDKMISNVEINIYDFNVNKQQDKLGNNKKDAFYSWEDIRNYTERYNIEYICYVPNEFNIEQCDNNASIKDCLCEILNSRYQKDYYLIPTDSYQDVGLEIFNLNYLSAITGNENDIINNYKKLSKIILNHEKIIQLVLKHKEDYSIFYPEFLELSEKIPNISVPELIYKTYKKTSIPLIFDNSDFKRANKILITITGTTFLCRNIIEILKWICPNLSIDILCNNYWGGVFKDYRYVDKIYKSNSEIISFKSYEEEFITRLKSIKYDVMIIPTMGSIGVGYEDIYEIANKIGVGKIKEISYLESKIQNMSKFYSRISLVSKIAKEIFLN